MIELRHITRLVVNHMAPHACYVLSLSALILAYLSCLPVRASLLPLSFALKKDGRPTARIVLSICNATDARRTVQAMKLASLFSPFLFYLCCLGLVLPTLLVSVACLACRCYLPLC